MPCEKDNSSAHLSRVLQCMRVGLWQMFRRKTKFVSFVLEKGLILQSLSESNADLLS